MASRQVHAVFVLDDGRPTGVVSDVDLLAGEWLGTDDATLAAIRGMTAGELMTSPVEVISATETVEAAAQRLALLKISRLLVCDGSGLAVGVLSVVKLVSALQRPTTDRSFVSDVMSHAIVTCRRDAPVHAAIRAMTERRSRSIVVIEGDRAIGVLTATDLLELYATPADARASGTVGEYMSSPVITSGPDLPLSEAVDRMLEREIHRLVVVDPADGSGPLGIVSTWDIVAEMAGEGSVWQSPESGLLL